MSIRERVMEFVARVERQEFLEVMPEFYAADAQAQENNEPPRVGLPALLAHERNSLAKFPTTRGRCLSPVVIDGDRVVIHWRFEFDHPSGAVLSLEELAWQTWRGDRLVSERFFYDPKQMLPPPR